MSIDEGFKMVAHILTHSLGDIVFLVVAILLIRFWLPGYLSEKGKNIATKEDIGKITEEIESVRRQHAEILENFKTTNQLRLAGLNERLQAHQEAFGLWREINSAVDTPEIGDVVLRCDKWWGAKCLYLEPAARSAFLIAFVGARDLAFYKSCTDTADLVQKTRNEINQAGSIIEESVALPHLNEPRNPARSA